MKRDKLSLETMAMKMGYQRLSWVQTTLIGVVGFFVLLLGIYHFTHGGMQSGTLELVSVLFLGLVLLLPHSTKRSYNRLSPIQTAFVGMVDLCVLFFGIYHLTTPDGMRSGVVELTAFMLLTLAVLFPRPRHR